MKVQRIVFAGLMALLVTLAGCGGGGSSRKVGEVGSSVRPSNDAYRVGDIVKLNDLEVVVHGFQDPFDAGAKKPAGGSRYVLVDAEVRNLSSSGPEVVSAFAQFELKDSEGETYDAIALPGTPVIGGSVPPGGTRRGGVTFEVPEASKGLEVTFKNLEFGTSISVFLG